MLFLLSPAKTLDWETPVPAAVTPTKPAFVAQAAELMKVLRKESVRGVGKLMSISERLAELNVERYAAWRAEPKDGAARPAGYAFHGGVYQGLDIHALNAQQVAWLQEHACILSGLYGVLRPLDAVQPYRLEMGIRLRTKNAKDLYDYWGSRIADYLNERQAEFDAPAIVNLASHEYARAVDRKALKGRWVDCRFEDWKNGTYKVISFYAKRARGAMVRYAATANARTPEALQGFDLEGYAFAADVSAADHLVFRRRTE